MYYVRINVKNNFIHLELVLSIEKDPVFALINGNKK